MQVSHCEHVRLNTEHMPMIVYYLDTLLFICNCPMYDYLMNYLIHAAPVHPSLCLQYFNPDVYCNHYCCLYLLLLLFHRYYCYKTVATDNLCRARLFTGAAELTTPLLRLISILCLPLCRINKLGFTSLEDCCDPLYLWVINDHISLIYLHLVVSITS